VTFLILAFGVVGGYFVGRNPHTALKYAVHGGMVMGQKIREIKAEIAETVEDQIQEENLQTSASDVNKSDVK
jgi:hypothetical protein